MYYNTVKSRIFAVLLITALFSAVILSGGCDGSSSGTAQEVSDELLAEAGYFGKYQPDSNELCFKLAEGTQLDWNEHKEQLEEQFGMELLEVAQLEKPEEQDSDDVSQQKTQSAENCLETNLQYNAAPLLLGQENDANDAAGQEIPADSSKLQVLNFGIGGSQDVPLSFVPADFMRDNPQLRESVEKLIIPEDVEEIGANAFADMPKLSRVVIFGTPNIGANAFGNCPNLEFVSIGCGNYLDIYREIKDETGKVRPSMHGFMRSHQTSVYTMGDRTFANCPKLQIVDFGFVAPPKFGNAVFEKTPLRCISVPYPLRYKNMFKIALPAEYSKYVASKTWMADLPDNQLITQLSIPGTHDSATFGLTDIIEMYGRTQGLNFNEQFDKGVRCFDMRLGYWGHSELYLGHAFSAGIAFSTAVNTIKNKLKSNPKEFVIIEFAWDGSPSKSKYEDMQNAVLKYNNDKNAVLFKPDLRLKDVRGKFLFMNCDVNDTKDVTLDSSICCRWGSGVSGMKYDGSVGLPRTPKAAKNVSWTQNKWEIKTTGADIQDKTDKIFKMFDDFARQVKEKPEESVWCFNYISGYLSVPHDFVTNYPKSAQFQNIRAANYITTNLDGPAGIVVMDYAGIPNGDKRTKRAPAGQTYNVNGDELLNAVINHNFAKLTTF